MTLFCTCVHGVVCSYAVLRSVFWLTTIGPVLAFTVFSTGVYVEYTKPGSFLIFACSRMNSVNTQKSRVGYTMHIIEISCPFFLQIVRQFIDTWRDTDRRVKISKQSCIFWILSQKNCRTTRTTWPYLSGITLGNHSTFLIQLSESFLVIQIFPRGAPRFFSTIFSGSYAFAARILKAYFLESVPSHLTSKKVQIGKDQEKAQSEKDSHSKNRGGKKPN